MKKIVSIILMSLLCLTVMVGGVFADVVSGSSSNVNGVAAAAVNDQTFEASDRPYVNSGMVQYGVLPGYFGENSKPGHQFISLDRLMIYTTQWSVEDAQNMLDDGTNGNVNLNISPLVDKVDMDERSKSVICTAKSFDKNMFDVQLLAIGTVNATNKKVTSAKDLAVAIKTASLYGATHIQFLGEGTNTELTAGGWGVGLNFTKATDTTVSSGGTGFSTGWAGYDNLPWQQFMLLKVEGKPNVSVEGFDKGVVVPSSTGTDVQTEKAVQNSTIKQ